MSRRSSPRRAALSLHSGLLALLLLTCAADLHAQATPEPLPAAEVWTNGEVRAILRDADGGFIIGGRFERVSGEPRLNLARILPDGGVDPRWRADANRAVETIAAGANGRLLVGGAFDRVAGVARRGLVRLFADGRVDTGFNAYLAGGVNVVITLTDGRLYVAGNFGSIDLPSGSVENGYLVRIGADGMLDQAFDLDLDDTVRQMALSDAHLYLAGGFSSVGGIEREIVARVDRESGVVDPAFNPRPSSALITGLNVDSLGRAYVAGNFTTIAGAPRRRIARFLPDGSLDPAYAPQGISLAPTAPTLIDAQDRIYLAARFDGLPDSQRLFARLLPDGSADPAFVPRASEGPRALAIAGPGEVAVAGAFFAIGGEGFERFAGLARLDEGGAFSGGSIVESRGEVFFMERTPAGILAGGNFRRLGDLPRANLARLALDGNVDTSFRADTDAPIIGMTGAPSGEVYVSGNFARIGAVPRRRFARLRPDGAVDPAYDPGSADALDTLHVGPSGRLYAYGSPEVGGQKGTTYRLAHDGTVDPLWQPFITGAVFAIAELPGGEVILGGSFNSIGGEPRGNLAKLDPVNAEVIRPWAPRVDRLVLALLVDPGGDVFVGGEFTRFNDAPSSTLLRLRTTGSGDAVPGFTGTGSNVVYMLRAVDGRLMINERARRQTYLADPVTGSALDGWRIVANDDIRAHVLGEDGDVFLGGDFQFVGDQRRLGLARVRFESIFGNGFDPVQ